MDDLNKFYAEARTPTQSVIDHAEMALGVGALAGAGYLFFEERPNDLKKIEGINHQYLQGTCPAVECGTKATDSMMRKEYFGIDGYGSLVLAAVSCIAIAHRVTRPQRWLRKQASANR